MNRTRSSRAFVGVALFAGMAACSADIHDNTIEIPDAKINVQTSVNVDSVMPQQDVPLMVTVDNVYLIEPSATPPPEHAKDACHLQIYLDDTSKPPLLVTAQTNVSVKVPADTKPGKHKLVCRVHKHDGTPTTTVFEVNINVSASVTVGGTGGMSGTGGAAGMPDAGAPAADAAGAVD